MQVGKYKESGGLESCISCSSYRNGTSTPTAGSVAKSDCKCDKGFYGDSSDDNLLEYVDNGGGFRCASCPAGKYKVRLACDGKGRCASEATVFPCPALARSCGSPGCCLWQDFVGHQVSGSSVWDFEADCKPCPAGSAAAVQCKNGTATAERDCSKLKTKADCRTKEDKAQCCVCGGGVKDHNPPAQTSCQLCAPGKYTDDAMISTLPPGEGEVWDLKCKKMTDDAGQETCQTGAEADYDANCQKCQPGTYSNRRGATSNKCCAAGRSYLNYDSIFHCSPRSFHRVLKYASSFSCPR